MRAAVVAHATTENYLRVVGPVAGVTLLGTVAAGPRAGAALAALAVLVRACHRPMLEWRNLLSGLVVVILVVPIDRYTLPTNLPFKLELYRIVVAVLLILWVSSLLVDPRVRARLGVAGLPLLVLSTTVLCSVIVNSGRVHRFDVGAVVAKRLTFFASFILVYFLIVSLVRTRRDVDVIIKTLTAGTAGVAVCAVVEYTAGYNVFNHLGQFLPLHPQPLPYTIAHGSSRLRVYASAQHPIALGALFVLVLPLTGYLWQRTQQRRWLVAAAPLVLGAFATQSRTAIIMLVVTGIVLARLRSASVKGLWPLVVPALIVIHFAAPGSLGAVTHAFFPKGGLIAQQEGGAGTYGSGRLADVGPSLHEYMGYPIFGEGYGTRITERGPQQNANILDDQWLSTLLDTGLAGLLSWIWVFRRMVRRLMAAARADESSGGWLCAAIAGGLLAFSIAMLTFDAFSFIQVTFVVFILFAIGAAMLELPREDDLASAA